MRRILLIAWIVAALGVAMGGAGRAAPLWSIGVRDGDTREFALAPGNFAGYQEDGCFAVSLSDPARDWPYVQPGPDDAWAGNRPHTFTIAFGVSSVPATGTATLDLFLVDTHPTGAPRLRIWVNGTVYERDTPEGAGDASVEGNPAAGRPATVSVSFPVKLLHTGSNEIAITSQAGSWMLYDAVALTAPGVVLGAPVSTCVSSVRAEPVLLRKPGGPVQPVSVAFRHFGKAEPFRLFMGQERREVVLGPGRTRMDLDVPPVKKATDLPLRLERRDGRTVWSGSVTVPPVRRWTVYLLAHSHNDIGYTAYQEDVLRKQMDNLDAAIDLARKSAGYPEGARFRWNAEVLWAVDAYLKRAAPERQAALREAVRNGWIELDALYANELTGLCRPEELAHLVEPAARIAEETGVPIRTAMITDVPGAAWGIVPVLAGAGVRYFSMGPNPSDRIGFTNAWADRPFYWVSPSGKEKVLCWMTGTSYNWFHGQTLAQKGDGPMLSYLDRLASEGYPYDLVQVRYTVHGDNGTPDETLSDTVRGWNERYVSPHLVIGTATEMFQALESRYGRRIPTVHGDFTPYWEDGAASSALETAMNRASAERLVQAGALWSLRRPNEPFPAREAEEAWRNVLLYSEHTWGAWNSVSDPDSDFVTRQWRYKKAFADDADRQSRALLDAALQPNGSPIADAVDVYNTESWDRTGLVTLPPAQSRAGDRVLDQDGKVVASQRLRTGELVFLAQRIPGFGGRRYRVTDGAPPSGEARASETGLHARGIDVALDPRTGEITQLRSASGNVARRLNGYLYVPGTDPNGAEPSGTATVTVTENGPLVASLEVRSAAPGVRSLVREVRVVDGLEQVEVADTIDKEAVRAKEGVHIRFDFDVPNGQVRMETPWAVVRPEADQLPGACKNWFPVQRWVDVSNGARGVTMACLDAPLLEVGGITAERPWMRHIAPSQALFSYVMNNYWHTNYRADQSGPTTLRYVLRPHGSYDAMDTARFGLDSSRPLVATPASGPAPGAPFLRVEPSLVNVESLQPIPGGKGWLIRLYGASGHPARVSLAWANGLSPRVYDSDLSGKPGRRIEGPVTVPGYGLVTLVAIP